MDDKTLIKQACNEMPHVKIEQDHLIEEDVIDKETGMHIFFLICLCRQLKKQ